MKRIFILLMMVFFAGNSWAQTGANSADALGKLLYTAIKTNNFNLIQNYCLTEDQLNAIRQQQATAAPENLQTFNADEYKTSLKSNFDMAVKGRSTESLTWRGVGLKTVKMDADAALNNSRHQVSMVLTDDKDQDFMVQFDTMALDNNYYFMGNIRLVNK